MIGKDLEVASRDPDEIIPKEKWESDATDRLIRKPSTPEMLGIAVGEGRIEASEARGQNDFVNSSTLPMSTGAGVGDSELYKKAFPKLGIKVGEVVDDLFVNVILPSGWTRKGSDHDMWSHLLDENKCERMSIFYKAAFYDRSAYFSVTNRFSFGQGRHNDIPEYAIWITDNKTGKRLLEFHIPENLQGDIRGSDKLFRKLMDWEDKHRKKLFAQLAEIFPNHEDSFDWSDPA